MQPDNSFNNLAANAPNNSLMYSTYTPTFGNILFQIQPSMTGEVSNTFGIIPYLSLESLIYQQQIQAQTAPVNIMSGQNQGQQNMQGALTAVDGTGNIRVAISGGSGNASIGSF